MSDYFLVIGGKIKRVRAGACSFCARFHSVRAEFIGSGPRELHFAAHFKKDLNMTNAIVLLIMTCSLLPAPQAHPLVGAWRVTYPWHVEVKNGVATPVMETGEMTVEARGDSLVASIAREGKRAIRLATRRGPGDVTFIARDSVTFTSPSGKRGVIAVSTWVLQPSGDQLSGTLDRRVEGIDVANPGPQRLSGQRLNTHR